MAAVGRAGAQTAATSPASEWPPAPPLAAADEPGPLPASLRAESVAPGRWRCEFRFRPPADPSSVSVAGSFNNWDPGVLPLRGPDAQGCWSGAVELRAGLHVYKFVVNGNRWLSDPQNPDRLSDGHGGENCVLRLGRIAGLAESDAQAGDGRIDALALEHEPQRPLYLQPLADGTGLVRLRTLANDIERARVVVKGEPPVDMTLVSRSPLFDIWEAVAPVFSPTVVHAREQPGGTRSADTLLRGRAYTFELADGSLRCTTPFTCEGIDILARDIFRTPEWARHAVWYQVFPDRFRNGDPSNDRDPVRPWTSEWFQPSPWEGQDGQTFYRHFVFDRQYGGDLAGLEEKLPYLKELGVNALYLNPVFQSESNHKYNATNYIHIDEHFGTKGDYAPAAAREDLLDPATWTWTASDKRFLAFLARAHQFGFRVIIDGVFNHVGTLHPAFQDVRTNRKESRFADWFHVTRWDPFEYEGWFGLGALPVFRKDPQTGLASKAVRDHIFAVTRRWMDPDGDGDPRDGIDGWRLDVPNEVPLPFWAEWRKLVKSVNPDAYIVGEIWDRAETWLDGRHFDAVMNYEFARPTVAWLFNRQQKIGPTELDRRLRELRLAYPLAATLVLQNLLNSHDTDRVASMALNPDRRYDDGNRVQDGAKYNNAKPGAAEYRKARLAALLQMTYVGAPMVYYGDEVGMWGADDPTCRKPMLWAELEPYEQPGENHVMAEQLEFYRKAIALRNSHPALRTGTFQTLLTDDAADVYVFLRKDADEQLVVALNASDRPHQVQVTLPERSPTRWRGVFGLAGELPVSGSRLAVEVPPVGGAVLHAATPK